MSRDHRKLRVFQLADAMVLRVYHATRTLPAEERFGLESQIRRAAVSTASNIVEGCTRPGTREYQRFMEVALGSAAEARYLIDVAYRLHMMEPSTAQELEQRYAVLVKSLQRLAASLGLPADERDLPGTKNPNAG